MASPDRLLAEGLAKLGINNPALSKRLLEFLRELCKWNRVYNLTAIRDPGQMITRHFLDSLVLLPLVQGRLVDVGSGAGFPAVPLALARPNVQVTAVESNGKKARFLRHVLRTLEVPNLQVEESRAEAFQPAQPFDIVTSRAFGSLAEFFEVTRHLLAPGGQWVAMKGKLDAGEIAGIPGDVKIRENRRLKVPGLSEERHAIIAVVK